MECTYWLVIIIIINLISFYKEGKCNISTWAHLVYRLKHLKLTFYNPTFICIISYYNQNYTLLKEDLYLPRVRLR